MHKELGVKTLVATCGGHLSGALLRQNLIDQVEIEVIPLLAGGTTTPSLFTSPDLGPTQSPTPLRLLETSTYDDGRILLSYAIDR